MSGMNRHTGEMLDGKAHIEQSVADILSTAIGSHVGLRDYGSLLPDRIDHPFDGAGILSLYAASAVAIGRWEKRLRVRHMQVTVGDRPSAAVLTIHADRTDTTATNSRIRLTVPLPL